MQLDPDWLAQQGEDAVLLGAVDGAFPNIPARIGVAVSGGGDSVALLHLFARWSVQTGIPVAAVTVDHGLRPESRDEAKGVGRLCQALGLEHDILDWRMSAGEGNLPAAARDGRYALMAAWAKAKGIGGIVLGHTIDDTAENFLIRLGRAAGIDGLARMKTCFEREEIIWTRPLAQQSREALRAYLRRHQIAWADDPSNDDARYTRTKARRLLPALADLGITAHSLDHSAFALRQARDALLHYTRQEAAAHIVQDRGDLLFPLEFEPAVPADIERRLVASALQWVGANPYPPRKVFAGELARALEERQRLTVAGCQVLKRKGKIRITREFNAVKGSSCATDAVWDTRWLLAGPHAPDLEVRALGAGVNHLSDWRETGLPRPTLMASPAVWRGQTLVAAPLAGYNRDWSAQIVADFTSFLDSH